MSDKKCPFCGSKNISQKQPYLTKFGDPIYSTCCLAMKRNIDFVNANYSANDPNKPDPIDIAKWK